MTDLAPLVLLGFGDAGAALARAALATNRARTVLATTRRAERARAIESAGLRAVLAERLDRSVVGPLVEGADVVVSFPPDGSTDALVAPALAGARAVVYVSSTGVYGARRGRIDDATPVDPTADRAGPRLDAERRYLDVGGVVLRAPGLYGPGTGLHRRLVAGTYRLPDGGRGAVSRVHLDDLATLALAALARAPGGLRGESFVVGDLAPVPQLEVVTFLCQRLGLPLPASAPLAEVPATLRGDRQIDPSRALRELGVTLRYPTYREGFEACLRAEAEASVEPVAPWFLDLELEPGPGLDVDEGVSLRFKAVTKPVEVGRVCCALGGHVGAWRAAALDEHGQRGGPASAAHVEDSSDGTALLVFGGAGGLELVHEATGTTRREPYLLLALGTLVMP